MELKGCMTAIITPMNPDGSMDEEGLRELVRYQRDNGIDGIIACGTTGESATLDHEEHIKVAKIVMEEKGDMKCVFGASSNNTAAAVEATKEAKELGVDAVLSLSPYYNKPTQEGLIRHYEKIDEVGVPIVVYNVPGRTSSNILPETILELAQLPNIVCVKEASGSVEQAARILKSAPADFSLMSGDDFLTYPLMTLGCKGVISVSSNIAPRMMSDMVHAALDGDFATARQKHFELMPLFKTMFIETNPIPVKTGVGLLGLPAGAMRLPLVDIQPGNKEILAGVMRDMGLIE